MKLTVELDLNDPRDAAVEEDLVARNNDPGTPARPRRRRRQRNANGALPLTPAELLRVNDTDRKLAREIAERSGMVQQ